jgi:hypothetical protein
MIKTKLTGTAGALFFILMSLCSCSAKISGALYEGGSADIALTTALEPRMSALIRSFQAFAGGGGGLVLDGDAMARSMANAPGVTSVTLTNTAPAALEGAVAIGHVGGFLSLGGRAFMDYTEGRLVIYLDLDTAPEVIALLSADARDYLSALMAPAATGEPLTRPAYLALVTALYGKPIADELSTAAIHASLDFPAPITSIQGGTAAARRADFTVPLLDLLVLDHPLRYEVTW